MARYLKFGNKKVARDLKEQYCDNFGSDLGKKEIRSFVMMMTTYFVKPTQFFRIDGKQKSKDYLCSHMEIVMNKRTVDFYKGVGNKVMGTIGAVYLSNRYLNGYLNTSIPTLMGVHTLWKSMPWKEQKIFQHLFKRMEFIDEQMRNFLEKKVVNHSEENEETFIGPELPPVSTTDCIASLLQISEATCLWFLRPSGKVRETVEEMEAAQEFYSVGKIRKILNLGETKVK